MNENKWYKNAVHENAMDKTKIEITIQVNKNVHNILCVCISVNHVSSTRNSNTFYNCTFLFSTSRSNSFVPFFLERLLFVFLTLQVSIFWDQTFLWLVVCRIRKSFCHFKPTHTQPHTHMVRTYTNTHTYIVAENTGHHSYWTKEWELQLKVHMNEQQNKHKKNHQQWNLQDEMKKKIYTHI